MNQRTNQKMTQKTGQKITQKTRQIKEKMKKM